MSDSREQDDQQDETPAREPEEGHDPGWGHGEKTDRSDPDVRDKPGR